MAEATIDAFLGAAGWGAARRAALAGDASGRRYLRLTRGRDRAVLMIAQEAEVRPFLRIGAHLTGLGLSAPAVLARDAGAGLLLLEDLGDALLSRLERPARAYLGAADVLARLHRAPLPDGIAAWSGDVPGAQAALAAEVYADRAQAGPELAAAVSEACARLAGPADVLMLRDFHADNLIWLGGRAGVARVGLLDFQDAMAGPAGYDLVSLLADARRTVDPALAARVRARYLRATAQDAAAFAGAEAAIGAARQLRILGVFARLALRGRPEYLRHMDRVWGHLRADLAHPELAALRAVVDRHIPPPCALRPELRP